jgi:5-carboxymethyl-2-hydroxymuconate isomerase
MPHLTILYSPNIEPEADLATLCRKMAAAMQTVHDESGQPVFPVGGIRVLAYPAAHHAVADGLGDHGFCYFNLRMGRGRSAATQQAAGQILTDCAKAHLAPLLATKKVGLTLQVDVGAEVFDARFGNLHPLFSKP